MGRETQVQLRVSFAEKAAIEQRAKKNGKNVSGFLRDLALQGFSPGEQLEPTVTPAEAAQHIAGLTSKRDETLKERERKARLAIEKIAAFSPRR